jgi:hypothetical protein
MAKFKNKEEAKTALTTAKEEKKAAFEELRAFEKENKLAKGEDHSGHEKLGKKWSKLKGTYDKKKAAVEEIETASKELKGERTPRATQYTYPEGASASEKKKIRAAARAAAKKAAKEANGEAKPAKEKKAEKAEKSEKKEGKSATKKNKEVAAETED